MSCPTAAATQQVIDGYVLERIEIRVRELTAALTLREDDQDCLRQEMALEVLHAARRFNVDLGDRVTFVEHVLARFTLRELRIELRRTDCPAQCPQSFSDIDFEPVTNDARAGELDERAKTEIRLDLDAILAQMPTDLQTLCRRLMVLSPNDARNSLGLTKEAYLAAIDRIVLHLQTHGVTAAFLVAD